MQPGISIGHVSEVTLRRARLILGWMTVFDSSPCLEKFMSAYNYTNHYTLYDTVKLRDQSAAVKSYTRTTVAYPSCSYDL